MSEEFYQWCMGFLHWERIILNENKSHNGCAGYIIAWDDPNLDNINKESWS